MKSITVQWVETPKDAFYPQEMRVTESNHPRFTVGSRFDFGFLQIASNQGYIIIVNPKN